LLSKPEDAVGEVELRPATRADYDFLYDLLKATMREYVAQIWGWNEQWQQEYFRQNFDPDKDHVIVLDGRDVGVISTGRKDDEIFLSKIYIAPEYQGRGIGTQLITSILDEALDRRLPVTLQLLKINPAKRLYERLGFVEVGETETHYLMKATPHEDLE
jgi:ribosomal protein S18 acetylase RimI-like enzyme